MAIFCLNPSLTHTHTAISFSTFFFSLELLSGLPCLLLFHCSSLVHKEFTVQGNIVLLLHRPCLMYTASHRIYLTTTAVHRICGAFIHHYFFHSFVNILPHFRSFARSLFIFFCLASDILCKNTSNHRIIFFIKRSTQRGDCI